MKDARQYMQWCDDMERRYDVMPRWYWDEAKRRNVFEITRLQRKDYEEMNR